MTVKELREFIKDLPDEMPVAKIVGSSAYDAIVFTSMAIREEGRWDLNGKHEDDWKLVLLVKD